MKKHEKDILKSQEQRNSFADAIDGKDLYEIFNARKKLKPEQTECNIRYQNHNFYYLANNIFLYCEDNEPIFNIINERYVPIGKKYGICVFEKEKKIEFVTLNKVAKYKSEVEVRMSASLDEQGWTVDLYMCTPMKNKMAEIEQNAFSELKEAVHSIYEIKEEQKENPKTKNKILNNSNPNA